MDDDKWLKPALRGISIVVYVMAIGSLAIQVIGWLSEGKWQPFPLTDLLALISSWSGYLHWLQAWVLYPQSWLGLHKILAFLHGSVLLWIIGCFLWWISDAPPPLRRNKDQDTE